MAVQEYKLNLAIADFEQSMQMLRHYDSFHWDITKFCFGQICVIIGACWYIYEKYTNSNNTTVNNPKFIIGVLLILSALFTLLCILSLLRNRTYFCKVSHYINEHRNNALKENEYGFGNLSNMWTDLTHPQLKDWMSTQFLSIYLLSICMIGSICFATYTLINDQFRICLTFFVGFLTLCLMIILSYWILKDS